MPPKPFSIHVQGVFHTFTLLDGRGQRIYDMKEAREEAFRQYPNDSWEIFNGDEGSSSEEDNA